jgi:hypothetical protein
VDETENGDPNPDAPDIYAGDVYCCRHTTGAEAWYWFVSVQVSDPQGPDTLADGGPESPHEVNVLGLSGSPLAEYGGGLTCDDKGECHTSWNENVDGIDCEGAENYTIEVIVGDRDGHLSEPWEDLGRYDTSVAC